MRKNVFTLALICVSFFCTTTCMAETVVKEKRETGHFRAISTGGGIDVYFTQNDSYSVVVEADEEYIDKIVTTVENETLVIKWKEKIHLRILNKVLKVNVSAPALDKVSASGGADFFTDKLKCDNSFQLHASGGSDADINNLTVAKNVDISVSGGADAEIDNLTVTGNTDISASGGADVDINDLIVSGDTEISASGGADCDVKNLQTRDCELSASGGADISVSGKANDVKVSASGGADVSIKKLIYVSIDITKSGGGDVHR